MIPYDDLVAALQAWRSRQGLPVNSIGGGSGPTPKPGSGPHGAIASQAGSGPTAKPGSGPNRGAPPPPPPSASRPGMPVAAAEPMEVSDELLDDEAAYENEGNDFAMSFGAGGAPAGNQANDDSATAIGTPPDRPTETDMGNDKDDW